MANGLVNGSTVDELAGAFGRGSLVQAPSFSQDERGRSMR